MRKWRFDKIIALEKIHELRVRVTELGGKLEVSIRKNNSLVRIVYGIYTIEYNESDQRREIDITEDEMQECSYTIDQYEDQIKEQNLILGLAKELQEAVK